VRRAEAMAVLADTWREERDRGRWTHWRDAGGELVACGVAVPSAANPTVLIRVDGTSHLFHGSLALELLACGRKGARA